MLAITDAAEHDIGVQTLAAQIEEAVAQPDVLGIFGLAEHRERQFVRGGLHLDLLGDDLDRAGGEIGIGRFRAARHHGAGHGDDGFGPQGVEQRQRRALRLGDDLGDAVMIAQIDEQHAAVITLAVDPAGQANGLADGARVERGAIVGSVGVHGRLPCPSPRARPGVPLVSAIGEQRDPGSRLG